MNLKRAHHVLNQLRGWGIHTICLCPGGRNAPFVSLLEKDSIFEVISFFDERSAGFFACGRIKRDGKPVAVLTTSGTAVSELLSPVIEAWYSSLPLVVVSADRPRRLRGTGAPQAIEQVDLFKSYVEKSWDLEGEEPFEFSVRQKPLHINICFDEPLIDSQSFSSDFCSLDSLRMEEDAFLDELNVELIGRPLCIVGPLEKENVGYVEKFLDKWPGLIFPEACSGLRGLASLKEKCLVSGDRMVQKLLKDDRVNSVLRLGDVPLGRSWRDLDLSDVPVISISNKEWAGRESGWHYKMDYKYLDRVTWEGGDEALPGILEEDRSLRNRTLELFEKYPLSEAGMVFHLQKNQMAVDSLYLGNSLPIRHWDLCSEGSVKTYFNRGANGIDGQISTAFGTMVPGAGHWILMGDLTALYDFNALWVTPFLKNQNIHVNLFVVNNFGGQIFSRLFQEKLFLNSHQLNFEPMARMWGWNYLEWSQGIEEIPLNGLQLIELRPDPDQDSLFQKESKELWS